MPLLPPEPSRFPDDVLTEFPAPNESPDRWWVIYTKAKAEKALARHLRGRRVAHFLPLESNTWRKNGRTFSSYVPLFPGYLFLFGDDASRVAALESNTISRVLEVPDQRRLLHDLRRIDRVLSAEVPLEPADALVVGQTVQIVAGPLAGVQGTLARHAGKMRLVVEVTFLRQAVSAEVEAWMVEPATPGIIVAGAA